MAKKLTNQKNKLNKDDSLEVMDIVSTNKAGLIDKLKLSLSVKSSIIILDKQSVTYHDGNSHFKTTFTEDVIADLEIINNEKLYISLVSFLTSNGIVATKGHQLFLILNPSTLFEHTITNPKEVESLTHTFIENVPFEHVSYTTLNDKKETKLLATNKDLLATIKSILEQEGFTVPIILPSAALDKYKLDNQKLIVNTSKRDFNQKLKMLEKYNLLSENKPQRQKPLEKIGNTANTTNDKSKEKIKNTNLNILLAIFSALAVVLVILIIFSPKESEYKSNVKITEINKPEVKTEKVIKTASEQSQKTIENSVIKIVYNSTSLKTATSILNVLAQQGFKQITLQNNQDTTNTSKTSIEYNVSFPQDLRDKINMQINKILTDKVIKDSDLSDTDVVITLGSGVTF